MKKDAENIDKFFLPSKIIVSKVSLWRKPERTQFFQK